MDDKPETVKPAPISGFPEWLPEHRLVELRMLDRIRSVFESYGYCSIETPLVERLNVLLAKGGDADREMYKVERLQAEDDDPADGRLGLRYDLTVPFARYVAQHSGNLTFPFKRYQMQPSWRGERPQEGRYRQFTQCDIDVVGLDHIPLSFDAELPAIAFEALRAMDFGRFQFRISNRKILQGYLGALGVPDLVVATRLLDKLEKIGRDGVRAALRETLGLGPDLVEKCVAFAAIATDDLSFRDRVAELGVRSPQLDEGLDELGSVMGALRDMVGGSGDVIADLSITRGFDYYTGTVYEARWTEFPHLGSICAGGRYDDLASNFTTKKIPGVGISIGFTRIFGKLVAEGRLAATRRCPTDVLVTWLDAEGPSRGRRTAQTLRRRGLSVEMYHAPDKLKKQLQYASRKGIPFVWFETDGAVKDMETGDQVPADPETWSPRPAGAKTEDSSPG
jgi:histidyl-tRNA synthetase